MRNLPRRLASGARPVWLGGALGLLVLACGKTLGPEDLNRITINAGASQQAEVGTAVGVRPSVKALSVDGKPIQGIPVTFAVTAGDGSVTGANATSDGDGVATVGEWVVGPMVGANTLTASAAGGLVVTFSATGTVGPAADMETADGDGQTATAGRPVPNRLKARVVDAFGNPVSGASVTFTVQSGGGSLNSTPTTTASDGVATSLDWTLGPAPGANTVTATSGSASVTFAATGVAGPVQLVIAAGDSQTATVASPLPVAAEVFVTDAQGLAVAGADVVFRVVSGGGSTSGDTVATDGSGLASVQWTLGTTAGSNTLAGDIPGLGGVLFRATGIADQPTTIAAAAGNQQFGAINDVLRTAPAAVVEDQYGNPVAGVQVDFMVTLGGGSVSDPSVITDSAGAAVTAWTMGPSAGPNELQASATGLSPFTFTATALTAVFDIEIVRLGGGGPAIAQSLVEAAARWESLVVGDLPDVDFSVTPLDSNACGSHPAVNDLVDDVRIFVRLEAIDGPGSVLGSAGPCATRDAVDGGLTAVGVMRFDIDDLDRLAQNGQLTDVVTHEIAHVLGFGTLWDTLLIHPSLDEGNGSDTHFAGPLAVGAFDAVGGANFSAGKVPVENSQGGQGTQDSHWRESVFDNELMTGFVDAFPNPLSTVTTESLADLGYQVNSAGADAYSLAPGQPRVVLRDGAPPRVYMWDDVRRGPIFQVDRYGRVTGVIVR